MFSADLDDRQKLLVDQHQYLQLLSTAFELLGIVKAIDASTSASMPNLEDIEQQLQTCLKSFDK